MKARQHYCWALQLGIFEIWGLQPARRSCISLGCVDKVLPPVSLSNTIPHRYISLPPSEACLSMMDQLACFTPCGWHLLLARDRTCLIRWGSENKLNCASSPFRDFPPSFVLQLAAHLIGEVFWAQVLAVITFLWFSSKGSNLCCFLQWEKCGLICQGAESPAASAVFSGTCGCSLSLKTSPYCLHFLDLEKEGNKFLGNSIGILCGPAAVPSSFTFKTWPR